MFQENKGRQIFRKTKPFVVVIGDSILAGLRRYGELSFHDIKVLTWELEEKQAENVLWRVNDIVLPKSFRSVVIHHGTNNVDTSSSDEISLGIVAIARSISHRHTTIEVIICGILPRDIHWST